MENSPDDIELADSGKKKKHKKGITLENWAQLLVVIIIVFFMILIFMDKKGAKDAGGMPGGMGGAPGMGAPGAGGKPNGGKPGNGMPGMGGSAKPDEAANTITVSAKTLKRETIIQTVHVNGDVSSKSEINVYPITSGKVTRLNYDIGDSVAANAIIGYLDPSRPGTAYAASPVKTPVAGTIIDRKVNVGDTVSANTAIATIGSLTDLEIVVYVSEKYSNYLKIGLPAYLSLTAYPEEKFITKITAISPVVSKNTRTIKVSLELEKPDKRIKPGMFAAIDLVIQQHTNALVVPKGALRTYNDGYCVFVIDQNNCAQRAVVKVGLTNDKDAEITEGVNDGDKVITAGSVTEGSPVRIAGQNAN